MAEPQVARHFRRNHSKITSIGSHAKPTNKHKRRSFKPYRGQGKRQ